MKRPWALPLAPFWALGAAAKNYAYDHHHLPIRRLQRAVISVGSLSTGGAGKTPVVIALAGLLARHNIAADVLTRGYGRGSDAIEQVDPTGPFTRFGDEPLEISQAQIPVFIGADRHAAGLLAEAILPETQVHILDDGFQHRRLARSLDLVLLTIEDVQDYMLPAGNLRERLTSLNRAHAVLLREEEAESLAALASLYAPNAQQWLIRRTLVLPDPAPQHALAFCGLARPEAFFASLRQAGCTLASTVPFPDHYPYSSEDIAALCAGAQRTKATALLTTGKDAVKLQGDFRERLESAAPLVLCPLRVGFLEEQSVVNTLLSSLRLDSLQRIVT